jgi:MYXO-CTERM domain-containing protein
MKFSSALLASLLVFGAYVQDAAAHINLDYPVSNTTDQKSPSPCGARGAGTPTTLKPGETITVKWTETISHPGHFRIAFDTEGTDDLKDPTSFTDIKNPAVAPILADGLHEHQGGASNKKWEAQVVLPNVTCTKCTLQVIQVMTDKPPFGPGGGNDFYYRCADIVLAGAGPTDGGAGDAGDAGGGSDTAGAGGASGGGGSPGAGGASAGTGGMSGAGGSTSGTGGSSGGGSGGTSGGAKGGSSGAAKGGSTGSPSSSDSGGGCAVGGVASERSPGGWALVALALGLVLRSRRRR